MLLFQISSMQNNYNNVFFAKFTFSILKKLIFVLFKIYLDKMVLKIF